jgi:hypothetical protein
MMRPPIFIVEVNGDVSAYESVEAAERGVESVDVEDGEYQAAYDADGQLLELHVETPTKRQRCVLFPFITGIELTPVHLRPLEQVASHQGDLRSALVSYLRRLRIVVGEDETFDAIVQRTSSLHIREKGFFLGRWLRWRR